MKIALHKYHVSGKHTAEFFEVKDEAMKEAFRIIRKECSSWLKANKDKPQNNNSVAEDVRIIRRYLKFLSYQKAFDHYNQAFGHELTLKLSYDTIGNNVYLF